MSTPLRNVAKLTPEQREAQRERLRQHAQELYAEHQESFEILKAYDQGKAAKPAVRRPDTTPG